MGKIRVGIVGYGNIGRGTEKVIQQSPDFELVAILTRRPPGDLETNSPQALKLHVSDALTLKGKVDVMVLCGGSATDLPVQGPEFALHFNTVDSYDKHTNIPEYFSAMNEASGKAGLVSIISAGWDPGLFSIHRVLAQAILPKGAGATFWGKGVSQGHSDAIRRIDGVEAAVQYTIPVAKAVEKARNGEGGVLTTREKHTRECFVVAKEGANKKVIENNIKTMPHYFADYDTVVHFISMDEYASNHTGMPHGGFVIHSGKTSNGRQTMEFSLDLCHNAEFTASVLVAYARAAYRCHQEGRTGAFTVLDVPIAYLSPESAGALRKEYL
jgi:diaminopimelate dehydrogenase